MTRPLSWGGPFALLLLLSVAALPFVVTGQRAIEQPRSPKITDWTSRHVIYTQFGTARALEAARNDPRAIMRWGEIEQQQFARRVSRFQSRSLLQFGIRNPIRRFPARASSDIHPDWSINLGSTGTANGMYPAKYTFDPTVTPSCTNDFVVFPIAANGAAAQANIVAFSNLYSGTAGSTGFCNRAGVASGTDSKTSATVMWSYNVHAIAAGGAVPTSPSLSLDGKKVAFVESATGSPAHFHVLAWRSGDTGSTNLQTTTSPKAITTFTTTIAPVATATTGVASDLALGAATTGTDTLSSPYIDYANDLAYVGNDIGVLYRIKNVFCTLPACTGVTNGVAPSLDSTWGTAGAVTVCSGKLTGPVLNFYNLNVYVGCSDGKLYSITQAGVVASIAVGDGIASKAFGGIVDPPIVDGSNAFVYAVSGSAGAGNHGVLVQAKADFSSSVAVPIGNGNQCNLHSPAFSNTYFTNATPAGAQIYIGGATGTVGPCTAQGATGGAAVLYGTTLGALGVLSSGAPANSLVSGNPVASEYAPLGEFFNSATGDDLLLVGLLRNNTHTFNNIYSFDIASGFTTTVQDSVTEGLGTSGMVFDNAASTTTFPQASSLYFNALNNNAACTSPQTGTNTNGCAVKLTQTGLQ
jgi:hypothetical protein